MTHRNEAAAYEEFVGLADVPVVEDPDTAFNREQQERVDARATVAFCLMHLRELAKIEANSSAVWGRAVKHIEESQEALRKL